MRVLRLLEFLTMTLHTSYLKIRRIREALSVTNLTFEFDLVVPDGGGARKKHISRRTGVRHAESHCERSGAGKRGPQKPAQVFLLLLAGRGLVQKKYTFAT
jgi:hypothetical protein